MMPETRASLLLRIRDSGDQVAWREFVEIYGPVLYRLARRQGMQDADAHDVAQTVLMSVARATQQREHDPARARFRTWLHRVAHNAILNALSRGKLDRGSGDSALHAVLEQRMAPAELDGDLLRLECRREMFRRAARRIRPEFQAATWDAFWLTMVDGCSCEEAARRLGKNVGSVYAARSRVMARLQEIAIEYDAI